MVQVRSTCAACAEENKIDYTFRKAWLADAGRPKIQTFNTSATVASRIAEEAEKAGKTKSLWLHDTLSKILDQ